MSSKIFIMLFVSIGFITNAFALTHFYNMNEIKKDSVLYDDLHIHPDATIRNDTTFHYSLTVYGNVLNEGIVTDNKFFGFDLIVKGDLVNDGELSCYETIMSGITSQNISTSTPITTFNFIVDNIGGIVASGNMAFENCFVYFNENTLDLTASYDLMVDSGYVKETNIVGITTSEINLSSGAYIENVDIIDCTLNGIVEIEGNDVWLYGDIDNYATIQNTTHFGWTLNIDGNLTNYGIIRDNPEENSHTLSIDSYGDLTNMGDWSGDFLNLKGTTPQTIVNLSESYYEYGYVYNYNETRIIAGPDLKFLNSMVDFSNVGELDLATNSSNLTLDGGYFTNGTIIGAPEGKSSSTLTGLNDSWLYSCTLKDLTLIDTNQVKNGVIFEGQINNDGILQNYPDWYHSITVNGNFTNNSIIQNNPIADWIEVNALGDLTNAGTWDIYKTQITGNIDQHISLINDAPMQNTYFYLISEFSTSPFQWYYNNEILDSDDFMGENWSDLNMNNIDLTPAYYGTYYCETGEGDTRSIYIYNGTFSSPTITSIENNGTNIIIDWDNIASAVSYQVYSSDDPYSDPATWTSEGEVYTNSCSIAAPVDSKKFYFVKAVY